MGGIVKALTFGISILLCLSACTTVPLPPQWSLASESAEAEYGPYLKTGTSTISGQAFLRQQNGVVITGAGRIVTLDPATSIGNEWWSKTAQVWVHRTLTPPSSGFVGARRTTTADADGRFKFQDLPAGQYYVRTEVTWEPGGLTPMQGGLLGQLVDVKKGKVKEVILSTVLKTPAL
jgi:hypothetical protein